MSASTRKRLLASLEHDWQREETLRIAETCLNRHTKHIFGLDDAISVGVIFWAAHGHEFTENNDRTQKALSAFIRKEQNELTGSKEKPKGMAFSENLKSDAKGRAASYFDKHIGIDEDDNDPESILLAKEAARDGPCDEDGNLL